MPTTSPFTVVVVAILYLIMVDHVSKEWNPVPKWRVDAMDYKGSHQDKKIYHGYTHEH